MRWLTVKQVVPAGSTGSVRQRRTLCAVSVTQIRVFMSKRTFAEGRFIEHFFGIDGHCRRALVQDSKSWLVVKHSRNPHSLLFTQAWRNKTSRGEDDVNQ